MLSPRLHNLFDQGHATYSTLSHPRTITASQTAHVTRVPTQEFAKSVMLTVDGTLAMLVMPARFRADLHRLSIALGGASVELASEAAFGETFPDCEPGAMPPFGKLYGVPVYLDGRLSECPEIVFNAGDHTECVRMGFAEFERLAQPETLWIAEVM